MENITATKLFPENETVAYYEGLLNEIKTPKNTRSESIRKIRMGLRAMYQNSNGNNVTRKELGKWHNPDKAIYKKDVWDDVIVDGYVTSELLKRAENLGYFVSEVIDNKIYYRSIKDTIEDADVLKIAKLKNISHNETRTYEAQIAAYNAKYYADKTPAIVPAPKTVTPEPVNQETTDMHKIILEKYDEASKEVDNITAKLEEILKSDEAKILVQAFKYITDDDNKGTINSLKNFNEYVEYLKSKDNVLDLFEWNGNKASTEK